MLRFAAASFLLLASGAGLRAVAADQFSLNSDDLAVGATYERVDSGDFRLGDTRFDWDEADRGALAFRTRVGGLQRVETVGGVDLYGERREGATPIGTLEDRVYGFDLQCALAFHLLEPAQAAMDLSFAPFLRAGIAWHELSIDDVETNSVRVVDEASGARFAGAFGADARLVIARKIEVFLGGGMQFWTGGTLAFSTYSGTGVSNIQSLEYSGQDVFVHLGALLWLGR